jgi:hypothetical protein
MDGYLPHIFNTSHTVISLWYTALDTKEPVRAAPGVVADAWLA